MESPFAGMLKTNYAPLDSEVEQICQFITGQMEELSRLEEQITHFPDIVDNLTRRRDALNEHIQDHRALISGARRIPRDVLEEVFVRCLPTGQNARMRADEAPVLLGHICSAWRQISMTSPRLWSSLHVDADPMPDTKLQQRVEAAESWLNRSGGLPLSISFTVRGHEGFQNRFPEYDFPKIQQLMKVFNACSRRWKSLYLSIPTLSCTIWSPTLAVVDVPMLATVKLNLIDPDNVSVSGGTTVLPMILKAQSLHTISLSGALSLPCIFAPYWGQLTILSLLRSPSGKTFGLTWQNALVVLHHSSNLRKCSLQLSSYGLTSVPPRQGVITLLRLQSFRIDAVGSQSLTNFLNVLAMPSLRHLAISCVVAELSNIPLRSLLTQPHVIETIELKLNAFSSDHLIELLALVPSLRGLCLVGCVPEVFGSTSVLDDDVIKRLIPDADGQCLCPCLKEVMVCSVYVHNEGLLAFLRARTQSEHLGITRLQRAVFSFTVWGRLVDIKTDMTPFDAKGLLPEHVPQLQDAHRYEFDETIWQKGWAYY